VQVIDILSLKTGSGEPSRSRYAPSRLRHVRGEISSARRATAKRAGRGGNFAKSSQ